MFLLFLKHNRAVANQIVSIILLLIIFSYWVYTYWIKKGVIGREKTNKEGNCLSFYLKFVSELGKSLNRDSNIECSVFQRYLQWARTSLKQIFTISSNQIFTMRPNQKKEIDFEIPGAAKNLSHYDKQASLKNLFVF